MRNLKKKKHLAKLEYFTNPDFPKIGGFPLLSHQFGGPGRVRSL